MIVYGPYRQRSGAGGLYLDLKAADLVGTESPTHFDRGANGRLAAEIGGVELDGIGSEVARLGRDLQILLVTAAGAKARQPALVAGDRLLRSGRTAEGQQCAVQRMPSR